jgi:hypothetical protein
MTKKFFIQDLSKDVVKLREKMDWYVTPILFGIIEKYGEPSDQEGFVRATLDTIKTCLVELTEDMVGVDFAVDLMHRHPTGEFYFIKDDEGTWWVEAQERMVQI